MTGQRPDKEKKGRYKRMPNRSRQHWKNLSCWLSGAEWCCLFADLVLELEEVEVGTEIRYLSSII